MRTRIVTGICALAVALAGSVVLVGCHHSSSAKFKVANIVFQNDQFFQLIKLGAHDAANQAGNVDLRDGNSQGKLENEQEMVDSYIVDKCNALLLTPINKVDSAQDVKRAKDAGMVVVAYNTPVDGGYEDAYIDCDAYDLGWESGQAAAAYINNKLGGKAKIALLEFKSLIPEQSNARTSGFKDALKGIAGVEYVTEQDAWLKDPAIQKAGDILTAHPDLDILWAANEGGTVGAVIAVGNAHMNGKVVVFGTDVNVQLLDFLKDSDSSSAYSNILQAITAQKPFEAGQIALQTALKALNHEPFDKRTTLKGVCLMRSQPDAVDAYETKFKAWTASNQ